MCPRHRGTACPRQPGGCQAAGGRGEPTCSAPSGPCFQPSASPVAQPDAAPFQAAGTAHGQDNSCETIVQPPGVGGGGGGSPPIMPVVLLTAHVAAGLDVTPRHARWQKGRPALLHRAPTQAPWAGQQPHPPSFFCRRRCMKQLTAAYRPPMMPNVCIGRRMWVVLHPFKNSI